MSSAETSRRFRHIGLISQQRRLRHLRSLSARNISREKSQWGTESLMETFFTFHIFRSSEAFYTSEKIQDSLNPTWRSFDLCRSCPEVNTSQSSFFVKVWGGHDSDYKLIIEWKVDLKGLSFVGNKIHKDGMRYQPNSIIFGMFDGFYSSADNLQESARGKPRFCKSLEVEQSAAIMTYNTYSLARLHTTQRAIRQTEVNVLRARATIIQKLSDTRSRTTLCADKEATELRVKLLREETESQRRGLEKDKAASTHQRHQQAERGESIRFKWGELHVQRNELEDWRIRLTEQKKSERQIVSQHSGRRAILIQELSYIYPILMHQNKTFFICGAPLPNAESNMQVGKDDTTVSTALGHTSHLVLMISKLLQIPLRYPIIYNGSRSTIHDHVTDPLADKDRDFPLFTRGKEKFHFNYAVYLLNRNIAQLRFVLGLTTSDLRATLPNLQTLLELKWGIKIGLPSPSTSQPVSAGSPRLRSSIGVQASIASPYLSPNPPNYSSAPRMEAPVLAENIPNSPPPPYHISEASQARDASDHLTTHCTEDATSTSQRETTTAVDESDMRDTVDAVAEGDESVDGSSIRDSGDVVAKGDKSATTISNNNQDEMNNDVNSCEDQRTSDVDSLPNGTEGSDIDDGEDKGRSDIGVSQPNYNSGDALSQDSLDLDSPHIGVEVASSHACPASPYRVGSRASCDTVGDAKGKSATVREEDDLTSASLLHNQSNCTESHVKRESATTCRYSNQLPVSLTEKGHGFAATHPPEVTADCEEVPFMAVDRIFHFDDISSRADALTNPGGFSSFRSSNPVSVNKNRSVSKS